MTWEEIAGNWTFYKGRIKERLGKLTDDELEVIDGEWDQLIGSLQVRYGLKRNEVERELQKLLSDWSAANQRQASSS